MDRKTGLEARLEGLELRVEQVRKITLAVLFIVALMLLIALGAVLKAAGI